MKPKLLSLLVPLAFVCNVHAADQAAGQPAVQPDKSIPKTPEAWVQRMTDFTQNASAYRDPKVFLPWLNATTEPGFYIAAMQGAMDPAGWLNMMNSMAHPDAVRNWMWMVDPNVYMKWLQAGADPAFYTSALATMTDPGKMMRWAMMPMDPKLWNLMLQMFNPNLYLKWGIGAMDPRAWQLMGNMMNPALYTGYLGAMADPNAAGLANWANWKPANAPTSASHPWGSTTSGVSGFNFFDPLTMASLLGMPSMPAPSAAPAAQGPNFFDPNVWAKAVAPQVAAAAPAPAAALPEAEQEPEQEQVLEAEAEVEPEQVAEEAEAEAETVPAPTPEVVAPTPKPVVVTPAPVAPKPVVVTPAPVAPKPIIVTPAPVAPKPVVAPAAPAPVVAAPAPSRMVLSGDALFKLGKAGVRNLSKTGKQSLDDLAAKIKTMGEVDKINIIGHADVTGRAKANQKLSEARARSVKSYLVAKGIKSAIIATSGKGDTEPVVQCDMSLPSKDLAECLAPNRRVEIEVVGRSR